MNINSPSTAVCRVFQWNWKLNRIVDSLVSCAWDLQQIMRSIIEIVFTFLVREYIDEKIYIDIFQNNGERSLLEWKGERELLCKSRLRRQQKVLEQLTAAVDENENQFHGCLTTNRAHHGIIITCKKSKLCVTQDNLNPPRLLSTFLLLLLLSCVKHSLLGHRAKKANENLMFSKVSLLAPFLVVSHIKLSFPHVR